MFPPITYLTIGQKVRRDEQNRAGHRNHQRRHSILWRSIWYRVADSFKQRQLVATCSLHSHDGYSRHVQSSPIITGDTIYRIGITCASAIGFGFGIAEIYLKIRGWK